MWRACRAALAVACVLAAQRDANDPLKCLTLRQDLELPPDMAPAAGAVGEAVEFAAPTAGVPASQRWIQAGVLAADHVAAGAFDSAMRLLNRRVPFLLLLVFCVHISCVAWPLQLIRWILCGERSASPSAGGVLHIKHPVGLCVSGKGPNPCPTILSQRREAAVSPVRTDMRLVFAGLPSRHAPGTNK